MSTCYHLLDISRKKSMISLIHPSRGRPEQSLKTIFNWHSKCLNKNDVQIIVCLDNDDVKLDQYDYVHPELYDALIDFCVADNKSAIEAINRGARISMGNIMIVVSDDTDCPVHWDKIITDAVRGQRDFVMKVDDGIQKNIVTMPIMDGTYYERYGYIYNPIYKHAFSDKELTEVAKRTKKLIKRMDIKFPHNHYSVTGEQPDATYKRSNAHYESGKALYQQRLKRNFDL